MCLYQRYTSKQDYYIDRNSKRKNRSHQWSCQMQVILCHINRPIINLLSVCWCVPLLFAPLLYFFPDQAQPNPVRRGQARSGAVCPGQAWFGPSSKVTIATHTFPFKMLKKIYGRFPTKFKKMKFYTSISS